MNRPLNRHSRRKCVGTLLAIRPMSPLLIRLNASMRETNSTISEDYVRLANTMSLFEKSDPRTTE